MGNCPPTFWQLSQLTLYQPEGADFTPTLLLIHLAFGSFLHPCLVRFCDLVTVFAETKSVTKSSGHCIRIYFCCCKSPLFHFLFHPIMTLRENFLANYPQQIINWQLADIFQNEDAVISSALTLIFILRGALVNRSSFRFF